MGRSSTVGGARKSSEREAEAEAEGRRSSSCGNLISASSRVRKSLDRGGSRAEAEAEAETQGRDQSARAHNQRSLVHTVHHLVAHFLLISHSAVAVAVGRRPAGERSLERCRAKESKPKAHNGR